MNADEESVTRRRVTRSWLGRHLGKMGISATTDGEKAVTSKSKKLGTFSGASYPAEV
jgi:hypothetical protein